nr:MAG TPA: Elongation factor Tu-B state, conserved switch I.6A [Caudoviricetes sp.]
MVSGGKTTLCDYSVLFLLLFIRRKRQGLNLRNNRLIAWWIESHGGLRRKQDV